MRPTNDLNVVDTQLLRTPDGLKADLPISARAAELVYRTREEIRAVLRGRDSRLLVVVGPCSVHDPEAAIDYAGRLQGLRRRYEDELLLVMRVYFEKPRTTVGWKGLVNDPHLNGSHDIGAGLRIARDLLVRLADQGIPAATEVLDPIVPQYLADLVCWAAIGARTTESQTHREMAGGHPRSRRCVAPAQFPGHRRRGAGRDRPHGRKSGRPHRPPRRQRGAELRGGARRDGSGGPREGRRPAAHARRLQP
jgi:3-deoxy-7-phosphoheptulonate synthase